MNEAIFDDEMLFDRLVDGELSAGERRRLLESLDTRPEGWRRCALAFLEAQSWREDLGQLARGTTDEKPAEPVSRANAATSRSRGLTRGFATLAIAASLLIAFVLGGLERGGRPAPDHFAKIETHPNQQVAETAPPDALGDVPADDALTLWVLDDGGKTRPVRVPLMEAGTLDREFGLEFQPGLTAEARKQLEQRGYAVQSRRRYAPMWLENGRPMVVPVEDTKIVPVGRAVY